MTTRTIFVAGCLCALACCAAGGAACAGELRTMPDEMFGAVGARHSGREQQSTREMFGAVGARHGGREQQSTQEMFEYTAEMAARERAAAARRAAEAEAARRAAASSSSGSSVWETVNVVLDVVDVVLDVVDAATVLTGGGARAVARRALTGGARAGARRVAQGGAARGTSRYAARREAANLALDVAQFAGSGSSDRPAELRSAEAMYGGAAGARESSRGREQQSMTDEMFGYSGAR